MNDKSYHYCQHYFVSLNMNDLNIHENFYMNISKLFRIIPDCQINSKCCKNKTSTQTNLFVDFNSCVLIHRNKINKITWKG